jgi:hypothetical protein
MVVEAPLLGVIVGLYAYLVHQGIAELVICSVGAYSLVNILTFAPLRHSHIDLRLGRLERLLLSPAHHRLHHSAELHHWDKNFGAIFPIWDWAFHTLLRPPPARTYCLGLPNGESLDYATLVTCYLRPFQKARNGVRALGLRRMLRRGPLANHPMPQRPLQRPPPESPRGSESQTLAECGQVRTQSRRIDAASGAQIRPLSTLPAQVI